tara:strand:+ start:37 stop:168 length:132 start_codon:yes stop_codon:yes gene_type:complete
MFGRCKSAAEVDEIGSAKLKEKGGRIGKLDYFGFSGESQNPAA